MRLRKLELKDAPLMLEWMHDKNVIEYLAKDFSSFTLVDCEKFIIDSQNDEGNLHLAIVNDSDEYQGTVSLKNIDMSEKSAEFAIAIRSSAIGKGIGKFAMQEIMKVGFEEMKLHKIYWNVQKSNKRAIGLYNQFGSPIGATNRINMGGGGTGLLWYEVQKQS